MRLICILSALIIPFFLIIPSILAEDNFQIKTGYTDILCKAVNSGPSLEVSYQYQYKPFACEIGLGYYWNKIHQIGHLHSLDSFIRGKVYIKDLYIGGGIGYLHNFIVENYDLQADIDNEINYQTIIGFEISDLSIELKGTIADLDIETGLPYETEIEKHSRLDSISIRIGKRF